MTNPKHTPLASAPVCKHEFAIPGSSIPRNVCRVCFTPLCRKRGWHLTDARVTCNLKRAHSGPCCNTHTGPAR